MKDDVEKLIDFIKKIVDDEFDIYLDGYSASYYFLNGGCLELVLVLEKYLPVSTILYNEKKDHFAIKYKDKGYDATGKLKDLKDFTIVSDEYIQKHKSSYDHEDIKFERKNPSLAIIEELNNCSGNDFKNLVYKLNSL